LKPLNRNFASFADCDLTKRIKKQWRGMNNKSFNQRRTPEQRIKILRCLGFRVDPDRINDDGWINFESVDEFDGDLSVNVKTGTCTAQYYNGRAKLNDFDTDFSNFDIVALPGYMGYCPCTVDRREEIKWIQKQLGIESLDAELFKGKIKAHQYLKKGSGNNFVKLPVEVLRSNLSPSAKLVWAEIYDRCGGGKDASWWSQNKIADNINVDKRTVMRAVKELERVGFLVVNRRKGSKSIYYPTIPTGDYLSLVN
jgi:hypothetical protein